MMTKSGTSRLGLEPQISRMSSEGHTRVVPTLSQSFVQYIELIRLITSSKTDHACTNRLVCWLLLDGSVRVNKLWQWQRHTVSWAHQALGLKKRCLIGVTRPTLVTLPTLHIFINFSTTKNHKKREKINEIKFKLKKKIKKKSLSFPVTHVCASGYH